MSVKAERRNAEIIAVVRACGNGQKVADEYGISRERVRQICKRDGGFSLLDVHGESRATQRKKAIAQRAADRAAHVAGVLAAYDGGISRRAIMAQWGINRGSLNHILKTNGRRERSPRRSRDDAIIAGVHAGLTNMQIADRTGVNYGTLREAVRRLRAAGRICETPPRHSRQIAAGQKTAANGVQ